MASKVYFTKIITPEKTLEMYKILKKDLPGKIAIKIHSGEKGNINFIKPQFWKPLIDYVKGTVVETNTAYPGSRGTTEQHLKVLEEHEWSKNFTCEILDDEGPDDELEIPNGILLKKNYVGRKMKEYESTLVLVHFKGHLFGGFGGALKQLSIGFASAAGKAYQHTGGKSSVTDGYWKMRCTDKEFKEAMADAASSVINQFKDKMAFVAVMKNISMDCDCSNKAGPPCMKDIGILSSTDPVALDQACLDLIRNSEDNGKEKVLQRIEEKLGPYILDCAVKLGLGKKEYELIDIDK